MKAADELRILRSPWRTAAVWLLAAALAVATVSLVLDGSEPAIAAGDCQYGPYGPYGPYEPYGPYGEECERVTPTLTIEQHPNETVIGFPLLAATATLEGADPTGTLVFRLFGPWDPTCESTTYEGPLAVSGSGAYYSFDSFVRAPIPDVVGTWRWTVEYSGDALNEPVSSGCNDAPVTVSRALMFGSIFVSPFAPPLPIGSIPEARMFIQGYQPSGAATVSLFGPDDAACSGTPTFSTSIPFDGQSALNQLVTLGEVDAVGTWRWQLAYAGDERNLPLTTACDQAQTTVVKAVPTLAPVSIPTRADAPDVLRSRVLLRGGYQPTGRVLFRLFGPGDPSCSGIPAHTEEGVVQDAAAEASSGFVVPKKSEGTWNWTASYLGDGQNEVAESTCGQAPVEVVKKIKKK
jgi:hypothetical protein